MADSEMEALRRQLEQLQIENQRLKGQEADADSEKLVITESEYHGYPTLTFQRGKKKPFSIGLKKLRAVIDGKEEVEQFLQKHEQAQTPTEGGHPAAPDQSSKPEFKADDYLA